MESHFVLSSTCPDCTRIETFCPDDEKTITETFLCSYHLAQFRGDDDTNRDPKKIEEARFLVCWIEELEAMTGSDLEDCIQWLGLTVHEYKAARNLAQQ